MPRPPSGTIHTVSLRDGTQAFYLRFNALGQRQRVVLHERAGCRCGCGGGWTASAARTELGNINARVRANVWTPNRSAALTKEAAPSSLPTFHEYASAWLAGKVQGVYSDSPIDANTEADYRWRLSRHLLPYFASYRLDEIDRKLCIAFKAHKLQEAAELRAALDAGADIRDGRGRRKVPLGASSMRKLIDTLAAILDDAVEDELITQNPARGKRMRVKVPKPRRSFLEIDELVAIIEAADQQDNPARAHVPTAGNRTRDRVASLAAEGLRPIAIAARLGLAKSTVSHHFRHLGLDAAGPYVGRCAIVEMLGRSGVRVSELCDLRIRHARLHDPEGARFQIPDAKTEKGIREVQMTPELAAAVSAHLQRLKVAGFPTGPDAYVFPNQRGGRISRQRVGKILRQAAELASERIESRGQAPLPTTTPHTMRRTYISIALLANSFDVKWVMSQVGHADSKMTMDVYAQLEQRVERSHGTAFDALLRSAATTDR